MFPWVLLGFVEVGGGVGRAPTRKYLPSFNDLERYSDHCQISYLAVQRTSCQWLVAETAVGDEILAWAGPVAHALATGAVPAVAGEFLV